MGQTMLFVVCPRSISRAPAPFNGIEPALFSSVAADERSTWRQKNVVASFRWRRMKIECFRAHSRAAVLFSTHHHSDVVIQTGGEFLRLYNSEQGS